MKPNKFHQYLKIICFLLLICCFWSCERDDICASATPTTPHLIIRFYNHNVRSEIKAVQHFSVIADGNDHDFIHNRTIDSIILPLKIEVLDRVNTTRFLLTTDTYDDNDDTPTTSNTDVFEISYTPELVYVSRACGYKSIFNELTAIRETDTNNWIVDFEVINSTIDNENAAHINIYH